MNILTVDDDPGVREILASFLRHFKHSVTPVPSGRRALEVLETVTPDVVLTDIRMPGMTGWELLRSVRLEDATGWIPFLFLTDNPVFPKPLCALRSSSDGFLSKPFYSEELMSRLALVEERLRARHSKLAAGLLLGGAPREFENLSAFDLLRILEHQRASAVLTIESEAVSGEIFIREGQFERVSAGECCDATELLKLLECEQAVFCARAYPADPPPIDRPLTPFNRILKEIVPNHTG